VGKASLKPSAVEIRIQILLLSTSFLKHNNEHTRVNRLPPLMTDGVCFKSLPLQEQFSICGISFSMISTLIKFRKAQKCVFLKKLLLETKSCHSLNEFTVVHQPIKDGEQMHYKYALPIVGFYLRNIWNPKYVFHFVLKLISEIFIRYVSISPEFFSN
jgi:hypothetical protein